MTKVPDNDRPPSQPIRPAILAVSTALGAFLVSFGVFLYASTRDRVAALPLILGLLFLLPLAASRRRPIPIERALENARRYRVAVLICSLTWLLLYAIAFGGNLLIGPAFARGVIGQNIIILGAAFFGVALLLAFVSAYADSAVVEPDESDRDE